MKKGSKEFKRLLSPGEVMMLLNLSLESDGKANIHLASCDEDFIRTLTEFLTGEKSLSVARSSNGCDTLIECAKKVPDILIIDDSFTDVSYKTIALCLKKRPDMKSIRILAFGEETDTSMMKTADFFIAKKHLEKDYFLACLRRILTNPDREGRPGVWEYTSRKWPRARVNISAQVEMFNVNDPKDSASGEVVIENISHTGAFLSLVNLDKELVPDGDYRLKLHIDAPPLEKVTTESVVIRLSPDESGGAGVRFIHLSEKDRIKIMKLFRE